MKILQQEFYILNEDYEGGYAEAIYKSNNSEVEVCNLCGGRKVRRTSKLTVYFEGKKEADIYQVPQYTIINTKVYNILKENDITGFNVEDIDILGCYDKKGNSIQLNVSGLKEMIVKGRCGYLRNKDGTLVEKCEQCDKFNSASKNSVHGLSINPDEWDGSDIFFFKNWFGVVIVTERVKNVLEQAKLKNIKFQNIKEFKFI